jgi:CheY-like chemotaxis protein
MCKRILLAEDETAVREAIGMLLMIDGHVVTEASNGREALERFEKEPFDLVITDLKMPEMPGNELAMAIRRLTPAQPILMITAHDFPAKGPENPVDAVLNKPFTLEALRRAIASVP